MGKVKNFVIEVQEFVWDFFNEDGNFIANKSIKTPNQLLLIKLMKSLVDMV